MTSIPPTLADPLVGTTRVVSMPTVVVLPAPLGPRRPKISPRPTDRSSPFTAVMPPAKTLVSPSVRMISTAPAGRELDALVNGAVIALHHRRPARRRRAPGG